MTSNRFQRIKSSTISTGFAFALAVLFIISGATYLHMVRATAASRAVLRMHTVESEFSKLLSLLTDAESAERGYVITGNKAYLEPHDQALDQIERKISMLYSLIKDPAQQQNLKEIELLIRARLDLITEILQARSNLGFTAAQQLVQTDKGRRLMNQLRQRVSVARQFQISLLEKQLSNTEAITKQLTALFLIGGILSFTILLSAFLLLTKEIKSRRKAQENAARSEQRVRQHATINEAIMASMGEGLYTLDSDGLVTYVNPAAEHIFGFSSAELMGRNLHAMIHYRHPDGTAFPDEDCPGLQVLHQEKPVVNHEDVFIRKNGEFFPVVYSSAPILLEGKRSGLVVVFRDITVTKQAQKELAETQERFESFMRHLPGAAFMKDLTGTYIYANPELARLFGRTLEEMLGKTDADLLPPETAQHFEENDNRALNEGSLETVELLRHPDGELHHSIVSKFIVPGPDSKPAYIGGVAIDITERIKAEEALRESEEKFRLLAENARTVIGIVQGEYFIYVNPYMEELSGYTRQEILKMPIAQMIHPDSRQQVLDRARRRQAGEAVETHYEFAMLTKSGQKRWLDFSVNAIHYHGKPAIVGIAIDITDRKLFEENLHNYKDQLENKNKEMESIIGIVSHDLRAPLVNIQGFSSELKMDAEAVDMLLSEVGAEEKVQTQLDKLLHHSIPESIQYIQNSAEAMNSLVAALVEVARAGLAPVKPQVLNMNDLIRKIIGSIETQIKQAGGSYDIQDMPPCVSDKTQVEQIFRNLLDNAIKYLDPNRSGQICVGGKLQAGTALYWVADNGIGISTELQEKIFEPYYQLKEKASGGLGLGLATVKKLVDRNNGKIWVISEKGKYSIFYVALAACQAENTRSDESHLKDP